jgi:cold-inducible RNA-binding protein
MQERQLLGEFKIKYGTLNRTVKKRITGFVWCFSRRPCYGLAVYSLPADLEKAVGMEEVKIYVGNLPRSTTGKELNTLFMQAGEVTAVHIITDRQNGVSKGYAFITMSAQSEADKAVSMLNTYFLDDHRLKVSLVKAREQRGFGMPY